MKMQLVLLSFYLLYDAFKFMRCIFFIKCGVLYEIISLNFSFAWKLHFVMDSEFYNTAMFWAISVELNTASL